MKNNPIIYKSVKFQVAFFISDNSKKVSNEDYPFSQNNVIVKIKQLTTLPSQKEFKTYNEARKFIRKLKEIL